MLNEYYERLQQPENYSITSWKKIFAELAYLNPSKCIKIKFLIFRDNNDYKLLSYDYSIIIEKSDKLKQYFFRMISASIYNYLVTEGGSNILISYENNIELEFYIKDFITKEIEDRFPFINIYANYGDEINFFTSESFNIKLKKEITRQHINNSSFNNGTFIWLNIKDNIIFPYIRMQGRNILFHENHLGCELHQTNLVKDNLIKFIEQIITSLKDDNPKFHPNVITITASISNKNVYLKNISGFRQIVNDIKNFFQIENVEIKNSHESFIGVDVGGSFIKVLVSYNGEIFNKDGSVPYLLSQKTNKFSGLELKNQIINIINESIQEVIKTYSNFKPDVIVITFPSPINENLNESKKIIRMTNFENTWGKDSNNSVEHHYAELSDLVDTVKREFNVKIVDIINDANAFGYYVMDSSNNDISKNNTIVVLPIGTGPGYVKIKNNEIQLLPQQGGHIIVDLSDQAQKDQGCQTVGCYGAYVPASASKQTALLHKITYDIENFIPNNFDAALTHLSIISEKISDTIVALCDILDEPFIEFILCGGVTSGKTGDIITQFTKEFIENKYQEYISKIKISLDNKHGEYTGAIGAIAYARNLYYSYWYSKNINENKMGHYNNSLSENILWVKNIINSIVSNDDIIITSQFVYNHLKYSNCYFSIINSNTCHILEMYNDYSELLNKLRNDKSKKIIVIGSGTVIDWAKYIANELSKELVIIPSAISTNGMFTEKAILYHGVDEDRERMSFVVKTACSVIFDFDFLLSFFNNTKNDVQPHNDASHFSAIQMNRSGIGDIISIFIALIDWELADMTQTVNQQIIPYIYNRVKNILNRLYMYQDEIKKSSIAGLIILGELLAEASLLNMRYNSSRPKDGSEHLLADQLEKYISDKPHLHGELVVIASICMAYFYNANYEFLIHLIIELGFSIKLDELNLDKELLIKALTETKPIKGKITFFDLHKLTRTEAEFACEQIFNDNIQVKNSNDSNIISDIVEKSIESISRHVRNKVLPMLQKEKTAKFIALLLKTRDSSNRIILNAAGRIGEIASFFGHQLTALNFNVLRYVEGTPEFIVKKDDLVLTLSGSGTTGSIINNLKDAAIKTKNLVVITAKMNVDTWKISESQNDQILIYVPGATKDDINDENTENYLPLSSSFEYSVMLYLEGIIEAIIATNNDTDDELINIVRYTISKSIINTYTKVLPHLKVTGSSILNLINKLANIKLDRKIQEPAIYFFGLGRNNNVARLFARRLQNIGYNVFVPGPMDIISKPNNGDIAIFISNSGNRDIILKKLYVFKGNTEDSINCQVVTFTANPNSELANKSDLTITLYNESTDKYTSESLTDSDNHKKTRDLKRAFETIVMFIFEGISVALMKILHLSSKDLNHIPKLLE